MKALAAIKRDKVFDTFFTKENIELLNTIGKTLWYTPTDGFCTDELKAKISDCDTYISCWGSPKITPDILECAPNLRLIIHLGSTVAPIVCPEVFEKGIRVISGFNWFSESTAEGAVAYILTAIRKIPFYSQRLKKEKIWARPDDFVNGLMTKKVGLIGYGGVGRGVAKRLAAFDVDISVYDIAGVPENDKQKYSITECGIKEIFEKCDVISLHLPYNDGTHHIIDDSLLSLVKSGALLVNTARGAVIDQAALTKHLKNGDFFAALDVFEKEPIDADDPLLSLDNVLILPHQAGVSTDLRAVLTRALIIEGVEYIDRSIELKNEIMQSKAKNMSKF